MDRDEASRAALGERVRSMRREKGWSQAKLAGDEMSASYVSLIESGRRNVTTDALEIVASKLGTSVAVLLGEGHPRTGASEHQLELRWARMALHNGDSDGAAELLQRVLTEPLTDDERVEARLLLASSHEIDGRLVEAAALLEQITPQLRENHASHWFAAQVQLCRCYKELGDFDRAIEVGQQALDLGAVVPGGDVDARAILATTLGGAYYERGDLKRASNVLEEVLNEYGTTASHRVRGGVLWNSSLVAAAEDRFEDALVLSERALAIFGESDSTRNLACLKVTYAWLRLEAGLDDVAQTRLMLEHARIDLEAEGSAVDLAACLTELARCALLEGDYAMAKEIATRSCELASGAHAAEGARARAVAGQASVLDGDLDDGFDQMRAAATTLDAMTARRDAARVWRDLAELAAHVGRDDVAADAMESAATALGIVPRALRSVLKRRAASVPAGGPSRG